MFSGLVQKIKTMFTDNPQSSFNNNNTFSRHSANSFKSSIDDDMADDENYILMRSEEVKGAVYDYVRTIRDPEKPYTLEDLQIVYETGIKVWRDVRNSFYVITLEFNPTVPHCSLATLIGLCIRVKLERCLMERFKLDIFVKKGSHNTEAEINKQVNDKERVAAALENPALLKIVEKCIKDED